MGAAARSLARAARAARDRTLHVWRGFTTADSVKTSSGAGEPGVGTGFGSVTVFIPRTPLATNQRLAGQASGTQGWADYLLSTGGLYWYAANSTPALTNAGSAIQLLGSDYGRVHVHIGWHTGAGATVRHSAWRNQLASQAAIAGYTAYTNGHRIGASDTNTEPASNCDILAHGTFRGVPTDSDLLALYDYLRVNDGQLPPTFGAMTMNFRWHVKRGLLGIATDGQLAPANMADSTAGVNMSRFGSALKINKVDVSREGRVVRGSVGHSTVAHFRSASSQGLRGNTTAFHVKVACRTDAISTLVQILAATSVSGGSGWQLYTQTGGAVVATMRTILDGTPSTASAASGTVLLAGDAMRPQLFILNVTSGFLRVYAKGTKVAEAALTGVISVGSDPFMIGIRSSNDLPASSTTLFEIDGGDQALTDPEIAQCYATFEATGRLPVIKAEHAYRIVDDIDDNGGAIPAVISDRGSIGGHPLARIGVHIDSGGIRGTSTAGAYYRSVDGGGILGDDAGFWAELLIDKRTSGEAWAVRNGGWYIQLTAAGQLVIALLDSVVSYQSTTPIALSDGRRHVALRWDFATKRCQVFVDGAYVTQISTVTVYTPVPAQALYVGAFPAYSTGYVDHTLRGLAGGHATPSNAEIAAAATTALSGGRVVGISGKTSRLYDLVQDVIDAGGLLPSTSAERISGSDNLRLYGARGLEVAHHIEHVWSYESDPIVHGLRFGSLTDYYVGAARSESAQAFMVEVDFTLLAIPGGAIRHLFASRHGSTTSGFSIVINTASLSFSVGNGIGTSVASPSVTLSSSHIGKRFLFCGFYSSTDAKARSYFQRAQVGDGGTALTDGYMSSPNTVHLGRRHDGFSATDLLFHGIRVANFAPTLAEHQAAYDRWAAGDQMSIDDYADRTLSTMYLLTASEAPAELADLVGTAHLTRSGAPTTNPVHARALGW